MRSFGIMGLAAVVLVCGVAGAQSNVYTFSGQSKVIQTGGFAGIHEEHSIEGQLQLTVDRDAGTAAFDWVDAKLSESSFLYTRSLGELFYMTKLTGKMADDATIEFTLEETPEMSVQVTVSLESNSIRVTGNRTEPFVADGFDYELDAHASSGPVGWVYHYEDDFSTRKAEKHSYSHSVFWPSDASAPKEPYLYYSKYAGRPAPGLVFMGSENTSGAHLNYCFPLGTAHEARAVKGTVEFDVLSLPMLAMPEPFGHLSYSISPDGEVWTIPVRAEEGHNVVKIGSGKGTCYVSFMGSFKVLDNLKVHLTAVPVTKIIHVPEDYKTIQAAINAAQDGFVVEVAPGVYSGNGNHSIDFMGKAITVRSSAGPEKTVIDCFDPREFLGAGYRGFYFHRGEGADSVLRGFTITGGLIPGNNVPGEGQEWSPSPKYSIGGGIYIEMSSPTIVDCVIVKCGTEVGGGIGCVGGAPAIVDCRIADCRAGGVNSGMRSGGRGAGIGLMRKANASIVNCVIAGNSGYYNSLGGGIYVQSSSAKVVGCEISSNSAEGNINGGGVYCGGASEVVLHNNVISNNTASIGAGVFAEQSSWGTGGGGQGGSGGPVYIGALLAIRNCTIAHNRLSFAMPPLPAGGIYVGGSNVTVKNCIVWYNEGLEIQITGDYTASPVSYSNVEDKIPGPGNISEKPLFAPTGVLDYHLQSIAGRYDPRIREWVRDNVQSPSIDAGDPDDVFGREPLPNGGRVNMGAYGNTREASKSRGNEIYHVDSVNGDDANDGLSRKTAVRHIQTAIERCISGDTVLVWPGVYVERIDFDDGKAIRVQSAADAAIIEAPSTDPPSNAVTFRGAEGPSSVFRNFVIRNSSLAIGIYNQSSPTISQLTIVDNEFGIEVNHVVVPEDPRPDISNCIFHNNHVDIYGADARYSLFTSKIMAPYVPLFADYAGGDYHLLSRRGRYRPSTDEWVIDRVDSIALDYGDPRIKPVREPMPNGGRLNVGAYGGTAFASMSKWPLRNDRNYDGIVNIADLASMAEEWLEKLPWVNRSPQVKIIRPYDRSKIPYVQETIPVAAEASDVDGRVVRVEFFANNVRIGKDTDGSDGWSIAWWSYSAGGYNLTAKATDDSGATTLSRAIHVSVVNVVVPK